MTRNPPENIFLKAGDIVLKISKSVDSLKLNGS